MGMDMDKSMVFASRFKIQDSIRQGQDRMTDRFDMDSQICFAIGPENMSAAIKTEQRRTRIIEWISS